MYMAADGLESHRKGTDMNRAHDATDTETAEDLDRLIAEQMLDLPPWWDEAEKRQQVRDMRPMRGGRICSATTKE